MKKLMLFSVTALMIGTSAHAQHAKDLPTKVKTAFDQKFPTARHIKWGKENTTLWEAEFKMDAKAYSANFDTEGNWIETEYEISISEIPIAVTTTLEKAYKGNKIVESEISETANGKVYEFEIKNGNDKMKVAVNADGSLIQTENVKEKDND